MQHDHQKSQESCFYRVCGKTEYEGGAHILSILIGTCKWPEQITITQQYLPFSIWKFKDQVMWDVVAMTAAYILLWRSCLFDEGVSNEGQFLLVQTGYNVVLVPLEQHDRENTWALLKISSCIYHPWLSNPWTIYGMTRIKNIFEHEDEFFSKGEIWCRALWVPIRLKGHISSNLQRSNKLP